MYTTHFGLKLNPFTIAPDPKFLFMAPRHEEALAHLVFGIQSECGFIQLTGEVGTGKTTLIRSLLAQLPENIDVALILNPRLDALEFVASILDELNVDYRESGASIKLLTDHLNHFLLNTFADGRRVVLIVDEAQNLRPEVLEQIRLLTNLETDEQKLLQIVLVGQPELAELLGRYELRQLAQRITARYHLTALTSSDVADYIRHRLAVAGSNQEVFTTAAINTIFRRTRGVPRLINVICDRALLGAYSAETHIVNEAIARQAADEVAGKTQRITHLPRKLAWPMATVAGLFAIGGTWALNGQHIHVDGHNESAAVTRDTSETNHPQPDADFVAQTPTIMLSRASEPTSQPDAYGSHPKLQTRATSNQADERRAFQQWLRAWGVRDTSVYASSTCDEAPRYGLRCLRVVGSIADLERLDRPALVSIPNDGQAELKLVILGRYEKNFIATIGRKQFILRRDELGRRWPGEFTVLWKPLADDIDTLKPGNHHVVVSWLRRQLLPNAADASNPIFDDALVDEVVALQRRTGIEPSGTVDPQTVIMINNEHNTPTVPRLSRNHATGKG